ncbi:Variant-specific surface protein [Giardia duodenalis]|uniref:Variant-specific surface protein n=1 Tax=Giardia intestinalis TaxID=5741 RepID=V6TPT3_GIAIN|nr:Variant-specific surface protein [Giardia intestinalis]
MPRTENPLRSPCTRDQHPETQIEHPPAPLYDRKRTTKRVCTSRAASNLTGKHQEAFSLHGLPCTAGAMFAKLIFASFVLQLATAARPAVKEQSGACTSLGAAGCATCSGSGSDEVCLSCTDSTKFIQLDKKGCTAACSGDGVIGDSTVNPKVCKCNESGGYKPQGGACVIPNTNKSSGLSTGAIAGIAVAAVVVVGGLVGFLCWWFLCRGEA